MPIESKNEHITPFPPLIEQIKTKDSYAQFNLIPVRIFLDTNALQYLQDFGEYIFEYYRESEEYFQTRKGKIKKPMHQNK